MDALDLALRCTSLLVRSMKKDIETAHAASDLSHEAILTPAFPTNHSEQMNESDCEKHFEGQGKRIVEAHRTVDHVYFARSYFCVNIRMDLLAKRFNHSWLIRSYLVRISFWQVIIFLKLCVDKVLSHRID